MLKVYEIDEIKNIKPGTYFEFGGRVFIKPVSFSNQEDYIELLGVSLTDGKLLVAEYGYKGTFPNLIFYYTGEWWVMDEE